MKKLSALLLVFLLTLALVGCGTDTGSVTQNETLAADNQDISAQSQAETQAPTDAVTDAVADTNDKISEDKAKSIALDHAGFKESDVQFLRVEYDFDDGVEKYEVDFKQGKYEYDYDINAKTGEILSYDKDIDD